MNIALVPHPDTPTAQPNSSHDTPDASPHAAVATPFTSINANADPQRKRSINSSSVGPSANDAENRRQRPKVSRACDICKTKKAKCSGTRPCESCAKKGLECTYEARYARGKPPTPRDASGVTSSPGYPDDADRFRFESDGRDRIQEARNGILTILNPPPDRPPPYQDRPVEREPQRPSSHLLPALPYGPSSSNFTSLQNLPSNPSRGSPEDLEKGGRSPESTNGLSFLHRAWKKLSVQAGGAPVASTVGASEENQPLTAAGDRPFSPDHSPTALRHHRPDNVRMPDLGKAKQLVDYYFDMCIATFRMLHRGTVDNWLPLVIAKAYTQVTPAQRAVIIAMLALATIHEDKATEASEFSPDELFCESARLTESETGYPTLESAQARLIQVLYLMTSSRMNQAWYTFGSAFSVIAALGLHRRVDRKRLTQKRDYVEEQCRKRTFWVAYLIDIYMSIMFGRPRYFHAEDIDQDLPDAVNDEDMAPSGPLGDSSEDCQILSLIFHAKIAQILGKISREVYSIHQAPTLDRIAASHRLGRELRQWRSSLPPFLGTINPSSLIPSLRRQAIALKLAYSHAVMLAHRPFLLKNLSSRHEVRDVARESVQECIDAARSTLENVDRIAKEGPIFQAFWFTHYVTFSALAVVYVWSIQQGRKDDPTTARLLDLAERCSNHLDQATTTISPSRRYSIILQELRAEAKKRPSRAQSETSQQLPSWQHFQAVNLGPDVKPPTPLYNNSPGGVGGEQSELSKFTDDWETIDWLDLDSSAFGPFPGFDALVES